MNGKKRNGDYWAVEFDGDEVRLCHFSLQGEQAVVTQCATKSAAAFDLEQFRKESGEGGSDDTRVLCAVPRREVLLKPFTVPRSGDVDVERIAALKLEQSVSKLDSDATFWGCIQREIPGEAKKVYVLAATIARGYVDGLIQKHFPGGERPSLMECGALAAVRAYLAGQDKPAGCELVVDCATDGLSIFLLRHGAVELAHFVPAGQPMRMILTEIRRVVLSRSGDDADKAVQSVTCLGGPAAEELATALRSTLSVPVSSQVEYGTGVSINGALPDDWAWNWHRVVGLIEWARAEEQDAINFLAAIKARRRRAQLVLPGLENVSTSLLVLALVGLLASGFLLNRAFSVRQEGKMREVIAVARNVTADLEHHEETLERLKLYRGERFSLQRILVELSDVAPPGVTLDNLTINPDGSASITYRGKKFPEGQEFAGKLNESELFESAVTPSQRRDKKQIVFKTTFKLTRKAWRTKQ